MWFRKKEVINGTTLEEWVKDHIEDKKYLKIYTGRKSTYKILDTFCSVNSISYGVIEKYRNNLVSVVDIVDRANRPDETLVFIEE